MPLLYAIDTVACSSSSASAAAYVHMQSLLGYTTQCTLQPQITN